ncbi:MAG TPA: hypothetical protein VGO47_09860, partial [Chlamydiales bacterium]|nr:hypothetical protein [Chlamydiales bacterium]
GFSDEGSPSLIYRSLADIYSDTPQGPVLTTTSLLSKLPSSTHLLMLPAPILTYKPYIDLSSSTVQIESSTLNSKLLEWFNKAADTLEGRIRAWMTELHTIRELWGLRRRLTENLDECRGLRSSERSKIQSVIDIGIRERAVEVARKALHDIEDHLDEHLIRIQQDAMDSSKNTPTGMCGEIYYIPCTYAHVQTYILPLSPFLHQNYHPLILR